MRVFLLVAFATFLGSCTFIAADVDLTPCHSHAECNVLNGEQDPGYFAVTTCQRWQCSGAISEGADTTLDVLDIPLDEGVCVFGPLDVDNDGAAPAACMSEVPGPYDCDDRNGLSNDGGEESCDGLDNDCDGVIDERVIELDTLGSIEVANHAVMWSRAVALVASGETGPALLVGIGGQGGLLELDALQLMLLDDLQRTAFSSCVKDMSCQMDAASLASRGGGFSPLMAFISRLGGRRDLVVGTLTDGLFRSIASQRRPGGGIVESNVSPAVDRAAGDVGLSITQGGASSPSVAVLQDGSENYALLAYHGDATGVTKVLGLVFGTDGMIPNLIQGTDGGRPVVMDGGMAAPTVVAVNAQGWLVLDATRDAVRVHYVSAFSGLELPAPNLLAEVPASTREVSMSLRPLDGDRVEVGLAWVSSGEVHWSSFEFDPTAPAAMLADSISVGSGSTPTLAPTSSIFRDREDSSGQWLVSFVQEGRLALARVGDGELIEPATVSAIEALDPTFVLRSGEPALYGRTQSSIFHVAAGCGL